MEKQKLNSNTDEINLWQRPNGEFIYVDPSGKETPLTPLTKIGDDPSLWTYTDANGRRYTPRTILSKNLGEITQGRTPTWWDKFIASSNQNYQHPILGAPARWSASWSNNTNPIKGLWDHPAITYGIPQVMAMKGLLHLIGPEGIRKTVALYKNSDGSYRDRWNWLASLFGDVVDASIATPILKYVPRGIDFLASPVTGLWTLFGNSMYRLKPGYVYSGVPLKGGIESSKIIHPARGTFNPILESDIPELENMLNSGLFRELLIPGSSQKVKMYFPSGNKQPIREDELLLLLSKYLSKRKLSQLEKEFAEQAPKLIKELKNKYGIDFSHENWFTGRPQLGSNAPGAVTQLDIDIFNSHIPEYAKLAESLQKSGQLYKKNGKWFGKFEDGDFPVNPEEYIVSHSNAFKDNWKWDGKNYLSGMSSEKYNKLLNNGGLGAENWGTTNGSYAGKIAGETVGGRVVGSLVGRNNYEENILSSPLKNPTSSNYFGIGKSVNNGVSSNGITTIPIIDDGKQSSWKVFGEDVLVKSLRSNNGDFSLKYKSPYKVLIPAILGGTFFGNEMMNNSEK